MRVYHLKQISMNATKRQITLYYDSTTQLGLKTYAAAQATKQDLLAIDISKNKVSGTQWVKLAAKMNKNVTELLDQDHNVFKGLYGNEKVILTEEDAIKIIQKHPETLIFPIAERGDRSIQCINPGDIHFLFDPDSQGTNLTKEV